MNDKKKSIFILIAFSHECVDHYELSFAHEQRHKAGETITVEEAAERRRGLIHTPINIGYFETLEQAEEIMQKPEYAASVCDGGYYNLFLIEEVELGCGPYGEAIAWYKLNQENPEAIWTEANFKKLDGCPEALLGICCFNQ